jgi:hypothetical protein
MAGGANAAAHAATLVVQREPHAAVVEELLSETADTPAFYNGATSCSWKRFKLV